MCAQLTYTFVHLHQRYYHESEVFVQNFMSDGNMIVTGNANRDVLGHSAYFFYFS